MIFESTWLLLNISIAGPLRMFGCVVAVVYLVAGVSAAHAALLAYEPFEYGDVAVPSEGQYALGDEDAGTNLLGGQNPVIGPTAFYAGPWIQSGGDSQVVKALPSLSYPDFPQGVGGIQQETNQFDCCSFGRTARGIAGGLGAEAFSRTIYESFLVNFGSQGTDDPADFGNRGHELWNGGVGDAFLAVQLYVNHFAGINELTLSVTTASGNQAVPVAGGGLTLPVLSGTNNGTHLVVLQFDFHPTDPDVVSVYLDPDLADDMGNPILDPGAAAAQISVPTSDFFLTHQGAFTNFTFSGAGHIPGAIDEIRWGETFADVTRGSATIPEPPALTLLVIGCAALCLYRKEG